jgi:hypothetical protein
MGVGQMAVLIEKRGRATFGGADLEEKGAHGVANDGMGEVNGSQRGLECRAAATGAHHWQPAGAMEQQIQLNWTGGEGRKGKKAW